MSEPKFTPGPLSANEEMPGLWGVRDEWGNATVFTNSGHYSDETRKANAILYAAAPKMYGALEIALAAIRKNLASYSVKDEQALLEAFNEIEAAMKEARGEK